MLVLGTAIALSSRNNGRVAMKKKLLRVWVLLVALAAAPAVQAELIGFTIGGRFTDVEGLGLAVGDRFTARYTFESTQTDVLPTPGGDYLIASYRLLVPALGIDVVGTGSIGVRNDELGTDQYAVALDIVPFIVINDILIFDVQISLQDLTGSVFGDESLPLVPPSLAAFDTHQFELRGSSVTNCAVVVCFNFGIIDVFAAPAPATPAVLLVALAALLLVRLPQRRRCRPARPRAG